MTSAQAQQTARHRLTSRARVLIVIENVSLARDHRARKQLASLLAQGYRVGVVCRRDAENARYRRAGLKLYEYPAPLERPGRLFFALEYGYSLAATGVLLMRALADGRYQAIQAGQPPDIYFLLAAPAKLTGTRFIVDQRDLSPEVYGDRFGELSGVFPRLLRVLERASWRLADHVFCVNESLRRTIVDRGGVSPAKVTVVGNGPRLESVRAHEHSDSRRDCLYRVCWLGVMGHQDHLELAMAAVSYYVHQLGRRDARFTFIGDGETLPQIRNVVTELGISEVVAFTGWLSEEGCFAHLADADLGLDTNLQPEVTPVKGLEYMAHSVPMVAFDLSETRALAGRAARYVAPGDAEAMAREIARLLDSAPERTEMGRAGRDRIERDLSWDRQQEAYLGAYARLMTSAVPAAPSGSTGGLES